MAACYACYVLIVFELFHVDVGYVRNQAFAEPCFSELHDPARKWLALPIQIQSHN